MFDKVCLQRFNCSCLAAFIRQNKQTNNSNNAVVWQPSSGKTNKQTTATMQLFGNLHQAKQTNKTTTATMQLFGNLHQAILVGIKTVNMTSKLKKVFCSPKPSAPVSRSEDCDTGTYRSQETNKQTTTTAKAVLCCSQSV